MEETREFELRQTGCIYRYRGVICKNKTKCETCGWNPSVEEKRKETVRKKVWGGIETWLGACMTIPNQI